VAPQSTASLDHTCAGLSSRIEQVTAVPPQVLVGERAGPVEEKRQEEGGNLKTSDWFG